MRIGEEYQAVVPEINPSKLSNYHSMTDSGSELPIRLGIADWWATLLQKIVKAIKLDPEWTVPLASRARDFLHDAENCIAPTGTFTAHIM